MEWKVRDGFEGHGAESEALQNWFGCDSRRDKESHITLWLGREFIVLTGIGTQEENWFWEEHSEFELGFIASEILVGQKSGNA